LAQTAAAAASLLAEGDRAHAGVPTDARDLLLDEIAPDPLQPRRHFDEQELRTLADDIARRGVLQPILVRPPETSGGPYRLVAGERRWRAARLAGKARIPARVRNLSDEDVQAAQLAENVLRTGLTDIEKGRALRRLYEIRKHQNYKTTWEDIAAEVGLGRARIHDLFNLASLPAPVATLIESGRLSGSHGIALQRAQQSLPEEQLIQLAQQAARPANKRAGGFRLSVARLRQTIQQHLDTSDVGGGDQTDWGGSTAAPAQAPRPFVRRTLEALAAHTLRAEERQLLREALSRADDEAAGPREETDHPHPQEVLKTSA
jgi:ParB family chromosome partitioning protein